MFYIGSNIIDWPYGAMRGVADGHHIASRMYLDGFTSTILSLY
jgi:hypothetical protein